MGEISTPEAAWPELSLPAWVDTYSTLHMWTQIIGKVQMTLSPDVNHWWHTTFHVTADGLSTWTMPYRDRAITIAFDFLEHRLLIRSSDGSGRKIPLLPSSVADFYREVMRALSSLGIEVSIWTMPVEVPSPVPFDQDHGHASYDREYVHRWWQALVQSERVFQRFRSRFLGKTSPVHFFWGAFDLAVTRFSGRRAPLHPGGMPGIGDWVLHEAYSHEVSSVGFWPGGAGVDYPAFYAYAYPTPAGFGEYPVKPAQAFYHQDLGEFLLPYDSVRTAADPDRTLMDFLQSTYEAAAELADWDRQALERPPRSG